MPEEEIKLENLLVNLSDLQIEVGYHRGIFDTCERSMKATLIAAHVANTLARPEIIAAFSHRLSCASEALSETLAGMARICRMIEEITATPPSEEDQN